MWAAAILLPAVHDPRRRCTLTHVHEGQIVVQQGSNTLSWQLLALLLSGHTHILIHTYKVLLFCQGNRLKQRDLEKHFVTDEAKNRFRMIHV